MFYYMVMICRTCLKDLAETEFGTRRYQNGIARPSKQCYGCRREYAKQHYRDNKEKYIEKNRRNNPITKRNKQNKVYDYLIKNPCVDCGEKDIRVLDFDHDDDSIKLGNVSMMAMKQKRWSQIEQEIVKCKVRCANCHRRRTAETRGYYSQIYWINALM